MSAAALLLVISLLMAFIFFAGLVRRNVHIWFLSYLRHSLRQRGSAQPKGARHLLFCFVDHFEPLAGGVSDETGLIRAKRWARDYPVIASRFVDADGRHPVHTFFYPEEEYRESHVSAIAEICRNGFGEFEVHLHHHNDTEIAFARKINTFTVLMAERHGLLKRNDDGSIPFAFIHGNWALDNSRRDGAWCGINNELILLRQAGCFADFTLPSAPSDTQTRTINSIYYATDDPQSPKSHDVGTSVRVGGAFHGDLMIVQGPLTLNWTHRRLGIWPRIENGDVAPCDIPIEQRVDLWVKQNIHVQDRPEWIFVKVHTHGATEVNADWLLSDRGRGEIDRLHAYLQSRYNDGERYFLHYVSAREAYNIIKAAESGKSGNPNAYRDFLVAKRH